MPVSDSAKDENAEASGRHVPIEARTRFIRVLESRWAWYGAIVLTSSEAYICLYLMYRQFSLATRASDLPGLLFVTGTSVSCMWSMLTIWHHARWVAATLLSQTLVFLLGSYVVFCDQRSPVSQMHFGKSSLAVAFMATSLSVIAVLVVWTLSENRMSDLSLPRGMAALLALVPLLGFAQFWVQTDYLPRMSRPPVDVEVDLSPQGHTGSLVHLLAKVTLHNRGTLDADVTGTLMRVTGYRKEPVRRPTADSIARGFDLSHRDNADFRLESTSPDQFSLLYADDFGSVTNTLLPGQQLTYKRVVDIDSRKFALARLSASGVFITHRAVSDTRSCSAEPTSANVDFARFSEEARQPHLNVNGGQVLCIENQFAPQDAVDELVSDAPVLRVHVYVEPSDPTRQPADREYPYMFVSYGTRQSVESPALNTSEFEKIYAKYPSASFSEVVAEYAPSDADLELATSPASKPPP